MDSTANNHQLPNETQTTPPIVQTVLQTTCCIVGGGPAGVTLALLLARQGIDVTLLEAHDDFDRSFRGDTLHPAILTILEEIGLIDGLFQIPHTKAEALQFHTQVGGLLTIDNFRRLKTRYPYMVMLPQARFLEFLVAEAQQYPSFHLIMGARVEQLLTEGEKICGVRYRSGEERVEVRATLTVGADGRSSRTRHLAQLPLLKLSAPLDLIWFNLPRYPDDPDSGAVVYFAPGIVIATFDRDDHWQIGCSVGKGAYRDVRAAGVEPIQKYVALCVPWLAERVEYLKDWKQIAFLAVESSRATRWYRPGLLLIGDAAHVMSPFGGVGINLAIQDAVATANYLNDSLKNNQVQTADLAAIQRRREFPTRLVQGWIRFIQEGTAKALDAGQSFEVPPIGRFMLHVPFVRTIPGRMTAFGVRQEHVRADLRQPQVKVLTKS